MKDASIPVLDQHGLMCCTSCALAKCLQMHLVNVYGCRFAPD